MFALHSKVSAKRSEAKSMDSYRESLAKRKEQLLTEGAEIEKTKVNICMECGACVFVCPAHRMIVHRNKLAKAELRAYQTKLAEQKKKEEENK